jgi:hypothetical protein
VAVDFSTRTLFNKKSGIIDEECLIVLEREGARDRMWRIQFDRVQSLTVWRAVPWWWSVPLGIIVVTSTLLFFVDQPIANGIGLGTLVMALLLGFWLVHCGNTHLAFTRDGAVTRVMFMVRPSKRKRIVQRIRENIAKTQARLALASEQSAFTATAVTVAVADNASSEIAAEQAVAEPSPSDQSVAGQETPDPYNPAPPSV